MYSEKLIDHFTNPRNAGSIEHPDGVGVIGHPGCGDYVKVYLRMNELTIEDIKFEVFGCPASIATISALSEMVKGRSLDFANSITDKMVEEAVGGLSDVKRHCSNLAVSAFQEAVIDYLERQLAETCDAQRQAALEPAPESAPEPIPQTALETAQGTAPETPRESAPETPRESAPQTSRKPVPETSLETTPVTAPAPVPASSQRRPSRQ